MKLFLAVLALCGSAALAAPTVDDKVYSDLQETGKSTVILHFAGHSEVLKTYTAKYRPHERSVNPTILDNILRNHANTQMASTLELLQARKAAKASGSNHSQLWAINLLVVHDVDAELLEMLKSSGEIQHIEADRIHQLIDFGTLPVSAADKNAKKINALAWGVEDINADHVWEELKIDGTGIVVGVTDTGVYAEHNLINYKNDSHSWRDMINSEALAYDDQGHGSHCAGTISGADGIGVAPGAQIIACKALSASGSGSTNGLLTCGQFMYCPTDPKGLNEDCTKRPKVVSNSWGTTVSNTFYNSVIDSWKAAGIIGVFANGNSGENGCSSTGSPADYVECLAVGATNSTNHLTYFSSRGPSTFKKTRKPDVAAPGFQITSVGITDPDSLAIMSGTSMATPHVAGVAALVASKKKDITQDQFLKLLADNKVETVSVNEECDGIKDTTYPNNHVGHGKVDALAAVAKA